MTTTRVSLLVAGAVFGAGFSVNLYHGQKEKEMQDKLCSAAQSIVHQSNSLKARATEGHERIIKMYDELAVIREQSDKAPSVIRFAFDAVYDVSSAGITAATRYADEQGEDAYKLYDVLKEIAEIKSAGNCVIDFVHEEYPDMKLKGYIERTDETLDAIKRIEAGSGGTGEDVSKND